MNEDQLNRLKAERMPSLQHLKDEIARIDHAISKAARPREVARYQKRRAVFATELDRRLHAMSERDPVMRPTRMY